MDRKSTHANQGAVKVTASATLTYEMGQSPQSCGQRPPSTNASPSPVWTRYVDSRLKQFCTR
jgi:hypothetical protein